MPNAKTRTITTRRRVADRIATLLAHEGTRAVFGIPGGTISPLNDALLDHPSIDVVVTRHETEAVFAACGHAIASQSVGVVYVTSGPGLTNALTGIAAAKCDRIPVVIFVGEVPRAMQGKGALQDGSAHHLDMRSVTRSLAKAVFEIADPKTAALRVADAFRTAREGLAGPVVVLLPMDVLTSEVPATREWLPTRTVTTTFDQALLDEVHARLIGERRPLLFAGSGMRGGDRPQLLRAFAERYDLPVVTSPKAKGVFPETHPLSLGVFGIGGHPSALQAVEAGVGTLIVLGSALGDLATEGFNPKLKPERGLIHVDLDPAVVGRSYSADVGVVAPVEDFLAAMLQREMDVAHSRGVLNQGLRTHADTEKELEGFESRIAPSRAIAELQRAMPANARFIIDSGEHFLFAVQYLRLALPDQFIALTGLGSMGASIGLAIGSQLAEPERPTCVIIGDGGLTMVGLELLDAAQRGLPIVVAMLNDRRLGMCELGHDTVYGRVPDFSVPTFDVPAFAASIGARGHIVRRAGEMEALASSLQGLDRPAIIDIQIDRSIKLPKRDRIGALGQSARNAAA